MAMKNGLKCYHWGRIYLFLALWIGCAASLGAQSNQAIDRLLDEKPATFGDSAYVILSAAGLVGENTTGDEAAAVVAARKLLPKTPSSTEAATLGEVCFLIMQTQGIKGGLFYRLFPGPRYATRELASLGLLKGYTHPNRAVSGEEVMWILGAVLDWKEKV
jgi:hypothetical protein